MDQDSLEAGPTNWPNLVNCETNHASLTSNNVLWVKPSLAKTTLGIEIPRSIERSHIMAKKVEGFIKILLDSGVIKKDQVVDADSLAKQTGKPIAQALVQLGYATEEEVMRALASHFRMEYVDLATVEIPEMVIELMPEAVARENTVLPLAETDGGLKVLMSEPGDVDTVEKLRFILNRDVTVALATRSSINLAINRMYGQVEGESADSILQ